MENFKGTKEKWVLRDNLVDITAKDKGLIITCYTKGSIFGNITQEEAESNALLISKAPEMLEMLIRLRDTEDFDISDYVALKQLIKEATNI